MLPSLKKSIILYINDVDTFMDIKSDRLYISSNMLSYNFEYLRWIIIYR